MLLEITNIGWPWPAHKNVGASGHVQKADDMHEASAPPRQSDDLKETATIFDRRTSYTEVKKAHE